MLGVTIAVGVDMVLSSISVGEVVTIHGLWKLSDVAVVIISVFT